VRCTLTNHSQMSLISPVSCELYHLGIYCTKLSETVAGGDREFSTGESSIQSFWFWTLSTLENTATILQYWFHASWLVNKVIIRRESGRELSINTNCTNISARGVVDFWIREATYYHFHYLLISKSRLKFGDQRGRTRSWDLLGGAHPLLSSSHQFGFWWGVSNRS
jgi:hypothetical protein